MCKIDVLQPVATYGNQVSTRHEVAASEAKRGASEFEKGQATIGINQILTDVRRPQNNDRMERLRGEIQQKLSEFEAIMMARATRQISS